MTKSSPEYLNLAEELLKKFAQSQENDLSAVLTKENLDDFQVYYTGSRARSFPPLKTLTLFMHQAISENKLCRNALISDARDQVALGHKPRDGEDWDTHRFTMKMQASQGLQHFHGLGWPSTGHERLRELKLKTETPTDLRARDKANRANRERANRKQTRTPRSKPQDVNHLLLKTYDNR